MLNAPSANMLKDGTFYAGLNFLDKAYTSNLTENQFNCLAYYVDITFLPFFEFNYRSTRELDNPNTSHTVDRMFSFKLRPVKERKYIPAIAVGVNDVLTTAESGNQYFNAVYIVGSKNIEWKKHLFGGSFGYAYPYSKSSQFQGIFGGVSYSPAFMRQITFMLEYDTQSVNIGGSVLFLKHLYVFGMLQGFTHISGGIAYRVAAYSGFKKKNSEQAVP